MSSGLPPEERAKWDALIKQEGGAMGLSGCRAFLENKLVNDIFYEGKFNGVPCVVKCSSRAPESIANEYEMSKRLLAADPGVCAEALALWRSEDGRRAFVVTRRLAGPSLTEMIARGAEAGETIRVMEDMLRIAAALQKAGHHPRQFPMRRGRTPEAHRRAVRHRQERLFRGSVSQESVDLSDASLRPSSRHGGPRVERRRDDASFHAAAAALRHCRRTS